jgi:hypothetical protein
MLVSKLLCEKRQMSAVAVPLAGRCSGIALPPLHLTLQIPASAASGARTLFIQNTNLDKTAALRQIILVVSCGPMNHLASSSHSEKLDCLEYDLYFPSDSDNFLAKPAIKNPKFDAMETLQGIGRNAEGVLLFCQHRGRQTDSVKWPSC